MFNFACLVNSDKKGKKEYINELNREKMIPNTPEQEREALLKLSKMLK